MGTLGTQLAMIYNSTVIEMCGDKFRISYSFWECQLLTLIAVTCTLPLKSGDDDITTFLRPLKVHRCRSNHRFHIRLHYPNILYGVNKKRRKNTRHIETYIQYF
jgi:hypothetical protein